MKKRIVSLFLALVMALSLIPTTVWAEAASGSENRGKVHVIVENTVYKVTTDADLWNDTLVDTDVTLNAEVNTMMDCIVSALDTKGYTAVGAESNYISKITHGDKELGEFDGGSGSGWMGTLNDWFTNRGFGEFTAVDGDEIRVMYTRDGGKDIGGDWTTMNDTSLTALSFSAGELTPAFNKDTHAYTLKLPEKDNQVTVTAAAANKQNQVYLSVGNAEYRRTAAIPMVHGTVLTIRCGDTKEASGEGENATPAVTPTTYTVTVKAPHVPAVPTAEVTIRSQMAGGYLHGFAEKQTVSYDLAEKYGYTDDVDGVSALDVLVRAHQLTYGEAFTKETAKDFLVVGSSGWISTIFGTATYASGFYLNQGYPNDGTPASYGGGYNGTFTTNTKVNDGDVLDFYVMEDDSRYSDYYTWLENVPDKMVDGDKVTVTVKGFYAMSGYLHKTPADLKAAAKPLEGVQLAWVDPATGAVTKIENAITDEDGKATFTVDKETATGTLAAVSYGDAEEYERVYTIMNTSVQAPVYDKGSVEVVFTGLHNAQLKDIKVYAYANGSKTGENLLADESRIVDGYGYKRETKLFPGDYWVEGYDENGDCNGSLVLTVEPGIKNEFKLQRVYQIYASNSGWALDEDYTLDVKLISADNQVRTIQLGKADCWGTVYASCIFVSGDTLEVTFTPDAEKHPDENVATVKKTLTDTATVSATCKVGVNITFDVPENSTVTVGTLTNYYVYSYVEPVSRDEATNTVTYRVDQNTDYFYRVQNPNGVTYWDYKRWSEGETITLTDDDLHIGDENFTKDTIYRFEKNVYDRADIYLNINTQGYKSMAVGETFELNSFRNWFAIESFMNAKVALPDMHYRGIDVNGQPSDVVTITPDAKNSNVATMTANKAGTAIVLVTYDAMIHKQGQSSTASKEFSAIWPECTGVFVVTVGSDGTGIKTNMILDRMDADIKNDEARQLDAEHDILFYLGDEGASYSFKPESGCTVTVARSTVGNTMTFNGFTNNGVTVAEDGTVTVTGLTTGRHIIKVEKNGVANYQVVTARGVSYKLVDKDGKELTEAAKAALKAGDTVNLQFSNLVSPKEKLSGAYNFNFSLYYQGEDGTFFKSNPGGNFGVYDFSGNPARQLISITIPKYWAGESYTLSGAIKQAGWPGVPTHRGITYAAGTNPGFNAPSTSGVLARLPELTLALAKTDFLTGNLSFVGSDGKAIARTKLTVTLKDAAGNVANVADNGSFKCYAGEYFYTISGQGVEYTTGSITVTKDGTNQFSVTLTVTSDSAWDGSSKTEPKKSESGVYQIATGAELAWFVEQSKVADVSGVLTADIELGKYAWLDITSAKKVELDGAGHEITGLNAKSGLFKQIGGGSHIQNLALRGTMTCASSTSGGSVVGYAYGKNIVIENCFSYVTVTGSGRNMGGIVGYANSNTTIRNCANLGAVTGSSNVGGIIGSFVGSGAVIIGCYNTGAVTATGNTAGGVFGNSGYAITVTNCYNTGAVSASSNAGGIGGVAKGEMNWAGTLVATTTVSDCYSVGTVTGGNGAFGSVDAGSVTVTSCYALAADANATVLTEEQMKSVELDTEAFGLICGGYPALKWQEDVTFHKADGGTVVPPTCTEKGYTLRTCTLCQASYRDTYVAATGHKERAGTKMVYPAYYTYTCDVCNELITVWADTRLEYVTLPATGVVSASMTDQGKYPWTYNSAAQRFESGNANVDKSISTTSFVFTLDRQRTIAFDFGVSSEEGYDKATITLSSGAETNNIAAGISGAKSDTYNGILTAGTWTLTVSFKKDDASGGGDDLAYISGLTIADTAPAAATEGAEATVTLHEAYTLDLTTVFSDFDGDSLTYMVSVNGADPVAADAAYSYAGDRVGTDTLVFTANDGEKTSAPYTVTLTVTKPVGPDVQTVYQTTGDYLASKGTPIVGSIGGEWLTIGLARSGRTVPAGYYDNAVAYVKKNINAETNRLDKNKSTDNARLILALTAISKDVTDVGGYDLLAGLDDMKYIKRQGTNGPVWALIALDSHDYTPAGSVTRDQLVETILSLQKDSGAWYINSTNKTDDVDMTAMAIQSLAPYYETNDAVKTAVDKALTWLGTMQKADGSFAEMAGAASSSESTAQVLVALCAMGIDPTADVRFVKNSFHVLDGLLTFYTGTAFKHQASDATVDQMATEQSYYALTAYMRLVGGQTALYDMTDVACGKHAFGAWTVTKAATCTEAGTSVRTCTVCGAEETQTIPALGHSMTAVAAKAATCTEAGHSAYWSCSRCGKFFSDAAGKTEIAKDRWVIAALGHDEATRAAVAATCYASGHEADTYCKRCGMVINAGANIPATGKHTYVNGVCTVCGIKNPTANVKGDDIKVDSKNDTLVKDSSGLVIKAEVTVDDEKLMEIKAAVESGSITVKVDNEKTIQTTDEQKKTDGGKSALEAKANAADTPAEVKNELTKLIDKLADMRKDNSGKKDAQIEKVVDVAVELVKTVNEQVTSVAQLIELPQSVTVTISITDEMYNSLLNRKVCVVRSHTDANGNVTTTELPAYLGGTEGNRVLSFQTDKASTFAIVSYETTSTGGGSTGGSGSITVVKATSANTADDSQMVIWLGSAVMAAAAVVVLTRKQKRVSK